LGNAIVSVLATTSSQQNKYASSWYSNNLEQSHGKS
jgi:hypothetical protein